MEIELDWIDFFLFYIASAYLIGGRIAKLTFIAWKAPDQHPLLTKFLLRKQFISWTCTHISAPLFVSDDLFLAFFYTNDDVRDDTVLLLKYRFGTAMLWPLVFLIHIVYALTPRKTDVTLARKPISLK